MRRLRRDLKESIAGQLFPLDLDSSLHENNATINQNESVIAIKNLEQQLSLMKKERDNSMQMWQNSLGIITQLETELKVNLTKSQSFFSRHTGLNLLLFFL